MSRMSQTVIRNPRMHGWPDRWPGIDVIRERSALSTVATKILSLQSSTLRELRFLRRLVRDRQVRRFQARVALHLRREAAFQHAADEQGALDRVVGHAS